MNFEGFKIQQQANTRRIESESGLDSNIGYDRDSKSLEGQGKKQDNSIFKGVGSLLFQMVYQGCDVCKTEVNHYVDRVICLGCNNSYKLTN